MIVYTVGTFDLLHVGHLALLNQCKSLGDILVVGVASDAVVKMYKPNVPVVPLEQRMEMLEALSCVDIVRPYHQLEYVSGCKAVGVDIFVVGEDWGKKPHNLDVNNYLRKMGKEIAQVTYNPRTSSTKIKNMVLAQSQKNLGINIFLFPKPTLAKCASE
ncbi:adenylyltransferase/cytidyltransferase family protein [Amylibacter sp.]|nr:adenylyltransferase/cytidyltransferase family protein [Amylibacter sp.]